MNSEELKALIEDARIKKGISQRELAKQNIDPKMKMELSLF